MSIPVKLNSSETLKLLEKIQPHLGRNDGPALASIKILLSQHPNQAEISLTTVFQRLWPEKDESQAQAAFRAFKKRINAHLAQLNPKGCMQHPADNRPVADKRVWFELLLTPEQAAERDAEPLAQALAQRLERGQNFKDYPDTPAREYIPSATTMNLPLVTFPEELERFARMVDAAAWDALDDATKKLLKHLGAKLEPIVQVVPVIPLVASSIVGFECLAIGPHGESFPQILRTASTAKPDLIRFLLAVAAVKTAETLQGDVGGNNRTRKHLFFTVNLDPEMLASPLLDLFLDRYRRENILFELNEKITDALLVRKVKDTHELRLVLDDWNAWKDRIAGLALEEKAEWTKMDADGFRPLMDKVGDWPHGKIINEMKRWTLPGKAMVVEGLAKEDDFRFLERHWGDGGTQPLYGQGFGVKLGDPWKNWLTDLKDFSLDGGFILADPLLGEVNRTVTNSLHDAEQKQLIKKFEGPLMRLLVPVPEGEPGEIILTVISAKMAKNWEKDIPSEDILVVREKNFNCKNEQIMLSDLPRYLQVVRHCNRHAREILATGLYPENYERTRYLGQDATVDVSTPSMEGRAMLRLWLEDPNSPPMCALLGDFGMGKTFLTRMFAEEVIQKRREQGSLLPVPFYLDMRLLPAWQDSRTPTLEEMVDILCKKSGFSDFSVQMVLTAVRTGHVFLIFDGFDEKSANMKGDEAMALMREIRRVAPKGSKGRLLLACRTHYFLNQPDEQTQLIGGSPTRTREGWTGADCRIIYLQPFDESRIQRYLEPLFPQRGGEILAFLKRVYNLLELAQRPFLLHLLTTALPQLEQRAGQGARVAAADVYQAAIDAWLARDDGKHSIYKEDKIKFMELLALKLWNRQVRHIHFVELRQWLPLQGIFIDNLNKFDTEMRTTAFFTRNGEGNYGFAHTSFQEFFIARSLARALTDGNPDAFTLPRLNAEILAFILDLLPARLDVASKTMREVLETGYRQQISENLFLLTLAWSRQWPETCPKPVSWQLQNAALDGIDMVGVTLEHVNFSQASLRGSRMTGARIHGEFQGADLTDSMACDARMDDCDFRGARLVAADWAGVSLCRTNFTRATIQSSWLQRARLLGANFDQAHLSMVRLGGVETHADIFTNATLLSCSNPSWPVPPSLPVWPGVVQSGHSSGVTSVVLSRDGQTLFSGSEDHTVKQWEVSSGRLIRTLAGHGDG
ncbi:MAG: EAL protein, partial [Magnetococcales bacterium]|nr:EAL protein [Magnetococcales bacterium]